MAEPHNDVSVRDNIPNRPLLGTASAYILALVDEGLLALWSDAFRTAEMEVVACRFQEQLLSQANQGSFDAILIDVEWSESCSVSLVQTLRERGISTPIVLLTARNSLEQRLLGFEFGADDCLSRPIVVGELAARLKVHMNRAAGQQIRFLRAADLTLDLANHEARRGDRILHLTSKEFALLEFLMRSQGRVLTRQQISHRIWRTAADQQSNLVDVTVGRLRRKVDGGETVRLIETERGAGYRMRVERMVLG